MANYDVSNAKWTKHKCILTAAIEGFDRSPAGGCVTSAPRKIRGSWNTRGLKITVSCYHYFCHVRLTWTFKCATYLQTNLHDKYCYWDTREWAEKLRKSTIVLPPIMIGFLPIFQELLYVRLVPEANFGIFLAVLLQVGHPSCCLSTASCIYTCAYM